LGGGEEVNKLDVLGSESQRRSIELGHGGGEVQRLEVQRLEVQKQEFQRLRRILRQGRQLKYHID
jgi:hypothetical protein